MKERMLTIVLSAATACGFMTATTPRQTEIDVDRLIVRKELIVSDTGEPWERGFEEHQIPRGIYAKPLGEGTAGLWVRARLIKGEIDDPFDDRFHALERNGDLRTAPGHLSWNAWLDGNWRQLAIIQGEGLEMSEHPREQWTGGSHPGRIRLQTFRPNHSEPLTDALIGQGKMSIGGGGFGGGGLPYAKHVLEVWGGNMELNSLGTPEPPRVIEDDGMGEHRYVVVAISAEGTSSAGSRETIARGRATIEWDSVPGADSYLVRRDGRFITAPLRIEGSRKRWTDQVAP